MIPLERIEGLDSRLYLRPNDRDHMGMPPPPGVIKKELLNQCRCDRIQLSYI